MYLAIKFWVKRNLKFHVEFPILKAHLVSGTNMDFCPLRNDKKWHKSVANNANVSIWSINYVTHDGIG